MKIVIAGGSGQVGRILARAWRSRGYEISVLSRSEADGAVLWDGKTEGAWCDVVDGCDAVVNLAGRSVNCRYTSANLQSMMDSRVDSTRAVGAAIAAAKNPPSLWLQASTATIYAHRFDAANDEQTGIIGGSEPGVPSYWRRSVDIAVAWERALAEAATPHTRKVALRSSVILSADAEGIFDVLLRLTRRWLGGTIGGGAQYVSWIHEHDFVRALDFLIARTDMEGAVNVCGPSPLPQRQFMAALRSAWGTRVGLPATSWMARLGAVFLRTDTELVLKSRRVVPGRLLEAGFEFHQPTWQAAANDLVTQWRQHHQHRRQIAPVPSEPG